jgi:hypothetical protein
MNSTRGYDRRARFRSSTILSRIEDIETLLKQGVNPLRATIHASNGSYRFTYNDIIDYIESKEIPFTYIFVPEGVKIHEQKSTSIRS